jgi:holo-[acyl-carrier protein] synthase
MIGIGIDAVDIGRFRQVLRRRPTIGARLFTDGEQAYGDRANDSAARLAVRFAAKEAVMKALGVGVGAFAFREVEVVSAATGAPSLVLHGRAAALAGERGVASWHLSLTHTDTLAQAVAVAV